jgi:hypothetical protein
MEQELLEILQLMLDKVVQHLQVERLDLKFKILLPRQHLEV